MSLTHVSPSLLRLARRAVVLALCLSVGLQWVVLQGIAWTGMMIKFSQQDSLAEAVSKTFDGEHPCPLCNAVKKAWMLAIRKITRPMLLWARITT